MQPHILNDLCPPILLIFSKWWLFYKHKSKGQIVPMHVMNAPGGAEV